MDTQDMHRETGESKPPRKRRAHESDPWYKRYARDFYEDTRDLKPDERGIYNDVVDLIYMAEGPLKDDERALAHKLYVDVRTWRRIRKRLLATGKLFISRGCLMNKRAKEVLAEREDQRRSLGRKGVAEPELGPDLFGMLNDSNGGGATRCASSDQSDQESEKEDRSFKPTVIEGGKADRPAQQARFVSEEALDKVRALAPGWDRQMLLKQFLDWPKSKEANNLDAAFIGWVKKFTKGKAA